jgi:alpha-beta hydrolase superfamily lysophospholipase
VICFWSLIGASFGVHAHVADFNNLVDDFVQFVKIVKAEHPSLPVFLLGESMGGAIALTSVLPHAPLHGQVRGMFMSYYGSEVFALTVLEQG